MQKRQAITRERAALDVARVKEKGEWKEKEQVKKERGMSRRIGRQIGR